MTDQSLLFQFGQDREGLGERLFPGRLTIIAPRTKINYVQRFDSEVAQIVMNRINQILARNIVYPRFVVSATSSDFGDNHETFWIRMERFLDDLIRNVRPVE